MNSRSSKPETTCRVCGGESRFAFRATVLGRHDVSYYFCGTCRHLRTQNPFWLEEAYLSPISRCDTGLVARNLSIAKKLVCLLDQIVEPRVHNGAGHAAAPNGASALLHRIRRRLGLGHTVNTDGKIATRYLDTAAGTGMLVRLMRDRGFDFRWSDKYCENVLAAGFEAAEDDCAFDAVTAFEALEHAPDPMEFIDGCLGRTRQRTLIFTTELFDGGPPARDWWYYAFPGGQHISFFSRDTLEYIARNRGLRFYSASGIHMLSTLDVPHGEYRRAVRSASRLLYDKIARRRASLTQSDYELLLKSEISR